LVGVFLGFLGALAGVAPPSARAAFFFSAFWSLFGVLAELAAARAAAPAGVDACWEPAAAAAAEAEAEVEEAAAAAPKSAVVSCSSCDSAASPPS